MVLRRAVRAFRSSVRIRLAGDAYAFWNWGAGRPNASCGRRSEDCRSSSGSTGADSDIGAVAGPSRGKAAGHIGAAAGLFFAPTIETFLSSPWRLSPRSDRMAYRLEGPPVQHLKGHDIVSDGLAFGAIQIPGDGARSCSWPTDSRRAAIQKSPM